MVLKQSPAAAVGSRYDLQTSRQSRIQRLKSAPRSHQSRRGRRRHIELVIEVDQHGQTLPLPQPLEEQVTGVLVVADGFGIPGMVPKPSHAVSDSSSYDRLMGRSIRSRVPKFVLASKSPQFRPVQMGHTNLVIKMGQSGQLVYLPQRLEEQILDLQAAAEEFGIPSPPNALVEETRRIAWKLHVQSTKEFSIHLMADGAVAVDVRGKRPDGVFIKIKEDGSAHCSGELEGKVWRKPYSSSQDVPDGGLLDELYRLRQKASE